MLMRVVMTSGKILVYVESAQQRKGLRIENHSASVRPVMLEGPYLVLTEYLNVSERFSSTVHERDVLYR